MRDRTSLPLDVCKEHRETRRIRGRLVIALESCRGIRRRTTLVIVL